MLVMVSACQKLLTLSSMPNRNLSCSKTAPTRGVEYRFFRLVFRALNTKKFFLWRGCDACASKPRHIRLSAFFDAGIFRSNPRYTNSGDSFIKSMTRVGIKGGRGQGCL
jgi:hypothetical protein